jgi:hypothetical protein
MGKLLGWASNPVIRNIKEMELFEVKTIEPGGPIKNRRGHGVTHGGTHKSFGGGCHGSYPLS